MTAIDVYTAHPIHGFLVDDLLRPAGPAAIHGVHWYPSRPPIQGLEFELDMRGVARELRSDPTTSTKETAFMPRFRRLARLALPALVSPLALLSWPPAVATAQAPITLGSPPSWASSTRPRRPR